MVFPCFDLGSGPTKASVKRPLVCPVLVVAAALLLRRHSPGPKMWNASRFCVRVNRPLANQRRPVCAQLLVLAPFSRNFHDLIFLSLALERAPVVCQFSGVDFAGVRISVYVAILLSSSSLVLLELGVPVFCGGFSRFVCD